MRNWRSEVLFRLCGFLILWSFAAGTLASFVAGAMLWIQSWVVEPLTLELALARWALGAAWLVGMLALAEALCAGRIRVQRHSVIGTGFACVGWGVLAGGCAVVMLAALAGMTRLIVGSAGMPAFVTQLAQAFLLGASSGAVLGLAWWRARPPGAALLRRIGGGACSGAFWAGGLVLCALLLGGQNAAFHDPLSTLRLALLLGLWGAGMTWLWCWLPRAVARRWLRVLIGPVEDAFYPLRGKEIGIGSHPHNGIRVWGTEVYPQHCRLVREPRGYVLQEANQEARFSLDFRNPFQQQLRSGDVIHIGQVLLQYGEATASSQRQGSGRYGGLPRSNQGPAVKDVTRKDIASTSTKTTVPSASLAAPLPVRAAPASVSNPRSSLPAMLPSSLLPLFAVAPVTPPALGSLLLTGFLGILFVFWAKRFVPRKRILNHSGLEDVSPSHRRSFISFIESPPNMEFLRELPQARGVHMPALLVRVTLAARHYGFLLEDNNPRNALLVNRRRLRRTLLTEGSVLDVGDLTLLYRHAQGLPPLPHGVLTPRGSRAAVYVPRVQGPQSAKVPALIIEGSPPKVCYLNKNLLFIGRSENNDLVLKAPGVQARHALIRRIGKHYKFVDLAHNASTIVNNRRLDQHYLCEGDQIVIDICRLSYHLAGQAAARRMGIEERTVPFPRRRPPNEDVVAPAAMGDGSGRGSGVASQDRNARPGAARGNAPEVHDSVTPGERKREAVQRREPQNLNPQALDSAAAIPQVDASRRLGRARLSKNTGPLGDTRATRISSQKTFLRGAAIPEPLL